MNQDQCPLCGQAASIDERRSIRTLLVICERCGRFEVKGMLSLVWKEIRQRKDIHLLSGVTRHATETDQWGVPVEISDQTIEDLLAQAPHSIDDRARWLLAELHRDTEWFGSGVKIEPMRDYPRGFCRNNAELVALLMFLEESGWIKLTSSNATDSRMAVLTARGFAEVEARNRLNLESQTVFVAMRFSDDLKNAYTEGIQPAIEQSGFRSVRIDLEEHNEDIVVRILAEIRRARFVVADFTGHRNGVYFEAGFALGLSLPVIWCCQHAEIEHAHFDTSHFNHVAWSDVNNLRERLALRIQGTVGFGPLYQPGH